MKNSTFFQRSNFQTFFHLSFLIIVLLLPDIGLTQTQYFTCGTPESSGQESTSAIDPPCTNFNNISLNIPSPSDPIKYVNMNWHIMQRSNPLDPQNFEENNPDHMQYLGYMFNDLNNLFGSLGLPVQGSNQPTNQPYVADTRIRFVLKGIYFHQDDDGWSNGGSICGSYSFTNYGVNTDCELNVFLVGNDFESTGCGPINYATLGYVFSDYQNDELNPWDHARFMAHEVGHVLGLGHSWCCQFTDMDCPSCRGNETQCVGISPDLCPWCNPFTDANCTNNIMSYSRIQTSLSALQVAEMNRSLMRSTRSSKFLKMDYDPGATITINTQVPDWEKGVVLNGDLVLETGGDLTIKCKVIMPEGGKIIVNKGAKLTIDGGLITLSSRVCNGRWKGIQVLGNSTLPQWPESNQGVVELKNGATIEYAEIAVLAGEFADNSVGGGIVKVNEAVFLNNAESARFHQYQNFNSTNGNLLGNRSYFKSAEFTIDEDFLGDYSDFQRHVYLHRVTGIDFRGCSFTNDYPTQMMPTGQSFADFRGTGILSYDSEFSVDGLCQSPTYPCTDIKNSSFRGFAYGINAANKSSVNPFRVTHTDFGDNLSAILANRVSNIYCVSNTFLVGSTLPLYNSQSSDEANRGIHFYKCTGYKIEENSFSAFGGAGDMNPTGVFIAGSGQVPNEVYKNDFSGLRFANLSNGVNKGTNPNIGLQYLCNTNDLNQFDFAVPSESGSNVGIAENQGSASENAGNNFTLNPPNNETHFLNKPSHVNYYRTQSNSPTNYTTNTIDLEFGSENLCQSKIPDNEEGHLSGQEQESLEEEFYDGNNEISRRIYAAGMLIRNYLIDTAGQNLAGVRTLLDEKDDLQSSFEMVDAWLQESQPDSAEHAVSAISSEFSLTGEDSLEYEYFSTLKYLQIQAMKSDSSDEQLVAANQNTLNQIAGAGDYYASVQAKILLEKTGVAAFEPRIILPAGSGQENITVPPNANYGFHSTGEPASLDIVPNPAGNKVTFNYRLPQDVEQARLSVSNTNGQLVEELNFSGNAGSVSWDTDALKEGIYFCRLRIGKNVVETKRLVIIR